MRYEMLEVGKRMLLSIYKLDRDLEEEHIQSPSLKRQKTILFHNFSILIYTKRRQNSSFNMKAFILCCLVAVVLGADELSRPARQAAYGYSSPVQSYPSQPAASPYSPPGPRTVFHAPAPTMTTYTIHTYHAPAPKAVPTSSSASAASVHSASSGSSASSSSSSYSAPQQPQQQQQYSAPAPSYPMPPAQQQPQANYPSY